jgi:hypothetical protein
MKRRYRIKGETKMMGVAIDVKIDARDNSMSIFWIPLVIPTTHKASELFEFFGPF